MSLTLGHIAYINCVPFFHYLPQCGFSGRIVSGVPSHLNRLLAAGEIDISPSSSFEYARNWRDYLLLPEVSISACGAVKSVLFFSNRPIDELDDIDIAVTGDSATSINLLKVILREFYGLHRNRFQVPASPVEETIAAGGCALLIGDRALRQSQSNPSTFVYDLGELWLQHTGLPFVFALWILRRRSALEKAELVRQLQRQLHCSRDMAFADLPRLAAEVQERSWMGEAGLVEYWQSMSYELGSAHLEGLNIYYYLCFRHGLLADMPELTFFP